MKDKAVFLYTSDRVLLLFFLINKNWINNDNIYVTTYEWKNQKKYIWDKLKGEKIVVSEESLEKNLIFRSFYIKKVRKKLKDLILKIERKEYILYGLDQQFLGKRLFFREDITVIEEGFLNYVKKDILKNRLKEKIKDRIFKILGVNERQEVLGFGKKVKKIYLTENLCKKIPKGLEKKAEIINLKELWNKKSEKEKKFILDIFNFNVEVFKKVNESTIMLFTQPLSEDKIITEEEKIELYSRILKNYKSQSIILKPHPREETDYTKYFKDCYIMQEKYPIEILELVGIRVKKVITIFSSAVFGLGNGVEIDFYGTEIHPKIFAIFGTQDSVMKRNAFLD